MTVLAATASRFIAATDGMGAAVIATPRRRTPAFMRWGPRSDERRALRDVKASGADIVLGNTII
jgi:hypothetical protein